MNRRIAFLVAVFALVGLGLLLVACASAPPESKSGARASPQPATEVPVALTPTSRASLPMTPTFETSASPKVEPSPASTMVDISFVGISGTVALRSAGASTEISLVADGFGPDTIHAVRILTGTCAAPGGNIIDLPTLRADAKGKAKAWATVQIPLSSLADGNHVVVTYFGPAAESSRVIACADIPSSSGPSERRN